MLIHPQINPIALQLGPLAIHWYGLTYLAAFGLFMFLGFRRLKHPPFVNLTFTTTPGKGTGRKMETHPVWVHNIEKLAHSRWRP